MTRETPLNLIHVENMERVMRAGCFCTACFACFLFKPKTLDDMIDFMAGRALDLVKIEHNLIKRWGE